MEGKESTVESSEEPAKNPEGPSRAADSPTGDPALTPDAIAAERDRLVEEKNDLTDRLLRRQAEFDNFRRRAERERADVVEYANAESVRTILPVLDDFERALKIETADKTYARGMELIYQHLWEALKKLGLEPITSKGQKFDPHLHHAVDKVETDQVEDHTILEEYQRGYNFRNRPLRPAMVKVAIKKK
jgi:molecular chaperone GrpE